MVVNGTMEDNKQNIGIGLIGTGFMAKVHSNAYHTMSYMFDRNRAKPDLAAIYSISPEERVEAAAERYGFRSSGMGIEALLNNPEVDVADICVGDALHYAYSLAALRAGKHVVCEKPLAMNAAEAKELSDAAQQSNRLALCGFNYRFVPAVLLAKQLIESGVMGRVYGFHGSYTQDVGADDTIPFEKLWYAGGPKSSGVTYGIGNHLIDMARFLVGEIASVSGQLNNYTPMRMSAEGPKRVVGEEEAVALVGFANGASGTLRISAVASGRKNRLYFEISCSRGSLVFDLEEINYLWVFHADSPVRSVTGFTKVNVTQVDRDHPFMDVWWPRGHGIGWEHAHINELACFLESIARNEPLHRHAASFYDGYRAIRIADAIKESDLTGNRIQVED